MNENEFIERLYIHITNGGFNPTKASIKAYAKELAQNLNFTTYGRLNRIVESVYSRVNGFAGFLNSYTEYLKKKKFPKNSLDSIRNSVNEIWEMAIEKNIGLVIGDVQSGKTANYTGLIARAADKDYKLFIVLAGTQNILRNQTQERLEEDFVGHDLYGNKIGIGRFIEQYPVDIIMRTTLLDDFHRIADHAGPPPANTSKPVVLVIKKTKDSLDAVCRWLGNKNEVRALIIDDEADNASLNTSVQEITTINGQIRRLLGLLPNSIFIAYTATPFANIFVDSRIGNKQGYIRIREKDDNGKSIWVHRKISITDDLKPEFFYWLPEPGKDYLGPKLLFDDGSGRRRHIRIINDCERLIPLRHKVGHEVKRLPESLKDAFLRFLIIRAIRNINNGKHNKHCTMMVNVSNHPIAQQCISNLLRSYWNRLLIKINETNAKNIINQKITAQFREIMEIDFPRYRWQDVKAKLFELLHPRQDNVKFFILNGDQNDKENRIPYRKGENKELTAVVVGGYAISRGLTLEGLCVSYFYKNTNQYDTLLQNGRWFGYRKGYLDLCRIWMSGQSYDRFCKISKAIEDLRQQVTEERKSLSIIDFDNMRITSCLKMKNAEIIHSDRFNGGMFEANRFLIQYIKQNLKKIQLFWDNIEKEKKYIQNGWIANDVDIEAMKDFIREFSLPNQNISEKDFLIRYIDEIKQNYPYGDVILFSNKGAPRINVGSVDDILKPQREIFNNGDNIIAIGRPKHERAGRGAIDMLGLSREQIDMAKAYAEAEKRHKPFGKDYRLARNKPLMILYIIENNGNGDVSPRDIPEVAAYAITFPLSDQAPVSRAYKNNHPKKNKRRAIKASSIGKKKTGEK